MKNKKLFALGMIIPVALCGCSSGVDIIINADEYEGIVLATENTVAEAVPIPDYVVITHPTDVTQTEDTNPEESGAETGETSITVSEQTKPPVEQTKPPVITNVAPAWKETPASGTMYVNTDGIYSRIAAVMGSAKVDSYRLNQEVKIIAKTNTYYFKVSSGAYIHSDYLSNQPVAVQTTVTAEPPVTEAVTTPEVTEPVITETEPAETAVTEPEESDLTTIMGDSAATVEQMRSFIRKHNPDVADSVIDMIPYYLSEGAAEGVRGDIAFAQSCLETGYFKFEKAGTGSAVTIDQNNFCGLGVTSLGVKGESFPTPQIGIRAQIQHLKAYGSTLPLNGDRVDNRFAYVVRGCAKYVEWLGMQENPSGRGWAGGANYGPMIMNIYKSILDC